MNSCAKVCLARAPRDTVVAVALLLAAACGGAVTNVGNGGSDGGGDDAGSDAASDASAADASASCATAVAGGACAIENESCSSGCNDPCMFCNILRCMGGTWVNLEAPPEPCVDASMRRHPDARMSWQGPGGFAGTGPALVVDGSGAVRVWQSEHGFDPTAAPTAAPSATFTLSGASVDALFDSWAGTDTHALPHPGAGAECSAIVYVTLCAHCMPSSITYMTAAQLAPEMNAVWSWFDTNLPAMVTAAHPSNYCHF